MATLAIVGGLLYRTGRAKPALGNVVIRNGKITAVGPKVRVPAGAELIEARGRVVTAGFIDAHTHLGNFGEGIGPAGFDANEVAEAATPHARALDGIDPCDLGFEDARRAGITAACVLPGSANVIGGTGVVIKTVGNVIDEMVVDAESGLKIAFGENPKFSHPDSKRMPLTRMGTAAVLRETLTQAAEYRRKRKLAAARRPDLDIRMETLVRVLARKIPLRAHAHRADDISTAVRIAKEFNCKMVSDHCTEGHLIAGFLASHKIPCVVGPMLIARFKVELRRRSYATAAVLEKAGCRVALATDHPFVPIDTLATSAAAAVREGMTPEGALSAVTDEAAAILGLGRRLGKIAPGYDGDVVVWSGHPIEDLAKPEAVVIEGEVVSRP
ncbi:MAG: amidohydrolase [Candidatus Zixiibacteriota bacterium]|jgi:imidazolonepropionase-like amidohydrolase